MMAMQRAIDEADIRRRMNEWVDAIRAMDVEGVASSYAPDITSFDVGPLLRQLGAEAKSQNWVRLFGTFQRPLDYEIRDLTIVAGHEVAFGYSLNRLSGTFKGWEEECCLGPLHAVLQKDRRYLAHRARSRLGPS